MGVAEKRVSLARKVRRRMNGRIAEPEFVCCRFLDLNGEVERVRRHSKFRGSNAP